MAIFAHFVRDLVNGRLGSIDADSKKIKDLCGCYGGSEIFYTSCDFRVKNFGRIHTGTRLSLIHI